MGTYAKPIPKLGHTQCKRHKFEENNKQLKTECTCRTNCKKNSFGCSKENQTFGEFIASG